MRAAIGLPMGLCVVATGLLAQAPRPTGSFAVLVEMVATDAADAVQQAEAAHAALVKDGAAPVAATYALALVYVRAGQLDRAVQTLDQLPNQAKLAPPVMRLRLYLAVERDEKALAAKLVPLIKDQALNDQYSDQEQLHSARLLGGIIGAIPAGETRLLPADVASATLAALSAAGDVNVKNAFRVAHSETVKRREKIAALLAGAGDATLAQRTLEEAAAEQKKTSEGIQATKDKVTATMKENKDADGEMKGKLRQLGQQARDLEREWKLETPGKPRQPVQPTKPSSPSRTKGKDGKLEEPSPSDQGKYDRAMRNYRLDLQKYADDVRTYPHRFAAWQEQDRVRRENLQANRKQTDAEMAATRKAQKDRDKMVEDLRDEVKRQSAAAQELDVKVALLRGVASGEAAKEGWISRPSHYGLLSFSAERQRLMLVKP